MGKSKNKRVGELTKRELEVAQLLGTGYPAKEIARRLGISARTVDTHAERIYSKVNSTRRVTRGTKNLVRLIQFLQSRPGGVNGFLSSQLNYDY